LNTLGACLVAEELGKTFVDFDFGDVPPVLFEANAEQQTQFLAPVISGEKDCALAVREPDSAVGGDGAAPVKMQATRAGEGWQLTGRKLAAAADLYLVIAQAAEGLTCFVVERGGQGVTIQERELILEGACVPALNVLGPLGGALALGRKYQNARWVRAAARKVGIAGRLLEMTGQYARDWKALGQALAVRPSIRQHLADVAIEIDAARWLIYHAASEIDEGKDAKQDAIRASLFAAEMVRRAIDRTIAIYGGPAQANDLPMLRIYGAQVSAATSDKILETQRFHIARELTSQ
jgi:acyl-CoA dehydrogenase